jgi:hypothetical protein
MSAGGARTVGSAALHGASIVLELAVDVVSMTGSFSLNGTMLRCIRLKGLVNLLASVLQCTFRVFPTIVTKGFMVVRPVW